MGALLLVVRMLASFLFKRSQCVQLPYHEPSRFLDIFCVRHKIRPTFLSNCFNRILSTVRERFKLAHDSTVLTLQLSPQTTEESHLTRIFNNIKAELGKVKLAVSEL